MVRAAKLAARIYAPLGTRMRLGDYVRVMRVFVEGFKVGEEREEGGSGSISGNGSVNISPNVSENGSGGGEESKPGNSKDEYTKEDLRLIQLRRDLKVRFFLFTLRSANFTLASQDVPGPPKS